MAAWYLIVKVDTDAIENVLALAHSAITELANGFITVEAVNVQRCEDQR